MYYAIIEDEEIKGLRAHPGHRYDNGSLVDDAKLAEFGLYRVIEDAPSFVQDKEVASQLPFSEWDVDHEECTATVKWAITPIPFKDQVKNAKARINQCYTEACANISNEYSDEEKFSWPIQVTEANVIIKGEQEVTPWVDSAAHRRGLTRMEMAGLIKLKDYQYRLYHGTVTGIRQALEIEIDAIVEGVDSFEKLQAIQWPDEIEVQLPQQE